MIKSSIISIILVVLGCGLCIYGFSTKPREVSESDQALIDSLQTEIRELTAHSGKLGDVSEGILVEVNRPTKLSMEVSEEIVRLVQDCGLVLSGQTSFEKSNEAGIKKAYYQFEGFADVSGITSFLQQVSKLDRALMVKEVTLRENTILSEGLTDEEADAASSSNKHLKTFTIVLEDSHKRDLTNLENDVESLKGLGNPPDQNDSPNKEQNSQGEEPEQSMSGGDSEDEGPSSESNFNSDSGQIMESDELTSMESPVSSTAEPIREMGTDKTNPESHEHEWEIIGWKQEPTHSDEGIKLHMCRICRSIEEFSDAECSTDNGHDFAPGACGMRVCNTCGFKETKAMHKWAPPKIYSEATCYMTGWNEQICVIEGCGKTSMIEMPMTEHKWVLGIDRKRICDICGASEETQDNFSVEVE